jgi:nicotinamide-nucleotide amidase
MPTAEIIAIGTELLLGVTLDTNTQYLAGELNRMGVELFRTFIVGDNAERITLAIQESMQRSDIVITSGGLGPTIDDPTRQAAANAFIVPLIFHRELWETICARFLKAGRAITDNNKRQAYLPQNAAVMVNEVGTAPAFSIIENQHLLICLPGVPAELKYIFQHEVIGLITRQFNVRQTIFSRIIHTAGLGESKVDEIIGDLEKMSNPTVGLTAQPGRVDIRITAKAENKTAAEKIIKPIQDNLHILLGENIYGLDAESLADKVCEKRRLSGWHLSLWLSTNVLYPKEDLVKLEIFDIINPEMLKGNQIEEVVGKACLQSNQFIMGLDETSDAAGRSVHIFWKDGDGLRKESRRFSSHESLYNQWFMNTILDFIRRNTK